MSHDVRVRPVADGDWDGIVELEFRAYDPLGLSEGRAALESRVLAAPGTCFVLELEQRLAGYVLALPYPASQYPDLARTEETVFRSSNLHLHDLVVSESLRGRGLAQRLLRHLVATAGSHGYEQISLVAVDGSETFWSANGFVADPGVVLGEGYGRKPVYMVRGLRPANRSDQADQECRTDRADRADGAGRAKPAGVSPRGSSSQDEVG